MIQFIYQLFHRASVDDSMEKYILSLTAILERGQILSKQSYELFGRSIRSALTVYMRRFAKKLGVTDWDKIEVWSNHQGLIVQDEDSEEWGVAESLVTGAKITPWEDYKNAIRSGKCKVRLYEVVDATSESKLQAQRNWIAKVKGTWYDFAGVFRLAMKSLLINLSDIEPTNFWKKWLRSIGDRAAGWKWANWCTEGVGVAYREDPPAIDVYQTVNPTPATHEQVAGELPRNPDKKTTLKFVQVTGDKC